MNNLYFEQPIFVWRTLGDPRQGKRRLDTVEDGISVLFLDAVYDYRKSTVGVESSVWTAALYYLSSAQFERTPASVGCAREATVALASASGLLATV